MTTIYIIAKDKTEEDGTIKGEVEWNEGGTLKKPDNKMSIDISSPIYSMCITEERKQKEEEKKGVTAQLHPRLFVETNSGIQQCVVNDGITLERMIDIPEIDAGKKTASQERAKTWRSSMTVFMEEERAYLGIVGYTINRDERTSVGMFRAQIQDEQQLSQKQGSKKNGTSNTGSTAEKLLDYVAGVKPLCLLAGEKSMVFYVETETDVRTRIRRGRVLELTQNGVQVARNKTQELYFQPRVLCLFDNKIYAVSEVDARTDRDPRQYLTEFSETLEETAKITIRAGSEITAFAVATGDYIIPENVKRFIPSQYSVEEKIKYGFIGNEKGTISIINLETKDILAEFDILSEEAKTHLNNTNKNGSSNYSIEKILAKEGENGNIDIFVQYKTMIVHVQSYHLLTTYGGIGQNTGKALQIPKLSSDINNDPDVYLSESRIRAFEVLVKDTDKGVAKDTGGTT